MNKYPQQAFLLGALLALISCNVAAESRLRSFLRNAADEIVGTVSDAEKVADTVSGPKDPAASPAAGTAAPRSRAGCPKSKHTSELDIGTRPADYPAAIWPDNNGCPSFLFRDLPFDTARAQKKAFEDASATQCSDCEGGRFFDAWAHFFVINDGHALEKFAKMQLDLASGQSISWKGNRYGGTVQATTSHAIGPFPCRQFHWTLKDPSKKGSPIVAEREGLFCEYKGEYEGHATWHEVI